MNSVIVNELNTDTLFTILFTISILSFIIVANILNSKRLKKAALALGDDFYVTGIPNSVWRKYARSFPEYRRLLRALAKSGDFSEENVHRFITSFTGGEQSTTNGSAEFPTKEFPCNTSRESDFSNPYSIDGMTSLGPSSGPRSHDISSHYNHDSGIGHSPGSGY